MAIDTAIQPKTGRRKEAVARVRLVAVAGRNVINGRTPEEYFKRDSLVRVALQPFTITNTAGRYSFDARVHGGGLAGQAGALRLAISRALARGDETLRGLLGREGALTRDPRMKERKKYGQPGARKRFQFSKR